MSPDDINARYRAARSAANRRTNFWLAAWSLVGTLASGGAFLWLWLWQMTFVAWLLGFAVICGLATTLGVWGWIKGERVIQQLDDVRLHG